MARPNCYIVGKYGIQIEGFGDNPNDKPEGIATELGDYLIRVLDYFGSNNWDTRILDIYLQAYTEEKFDMEVQTVPRVIANAHYATSLAFGYSDHKDNYLEKCALISGVAWIVKWFEANNLDVRFVISVKHTYNRNRPYKHGGKRI